MADPRGVNAYISCPMTVDIGHFNKVKAALEKVLKEACKIQAQCTYWVRNSTYRSEVLDNADIVVVIPPTFGQSGKFANKLTVFPTGTQKEVIKTYKRDEQVIFMAYTTATGEIKFYNVSIDSNLQNFDGCAGTTRNIYTELEKLSDQKLSILKGKTENLKEAYSGIKNITIQGSNGIVIDVHPNQGVVFTADKDYPRINRNVLLLKRRK